MTNRISVVEIISILLSAFLLMLVAYSVVLAADKAGLKEEIKQAVLKELADTVPGELEIKGFRIVKGLETINGKGDYKIGTVTMGSYNGPNRMSFSVDVADERSNTGNLTAEVSFDVLKDVFVASRLLGRGTVLSGDDFYIVKQKSSRLASSVVSDKKDFEGMTLKASIGQGVVLRADHFTAEPVVKKGQKVELRVEGSSVVIAAHGVLRNDATVGGVAKVLCDVSKKEISGILVNSNTVKVKI